MNEMTRGKIVCEFTTKSGKKATIRYPLTDDTEVMRVFINEISKEDTFVLFSGEVVTLEEEVKFVNETLQAIQQHNAVYLLCFIENDLVGSTSVMRNTQGKTRFLHTAHVGLIVRNKYRNDGIGRRLLQEAIKEVKMRMPDLRLLLLGVFVGNHAAYMLYQSLGFKEYGRAPGEILHKGKYVDHILMYMNL